MGSRGFCGTVEATRRRRRRSPGGLAGVDAGSSLALSDEVCGALVGNDLKVVGTTGV